MITRLTACLTVALCATAGPAGADIAGEPSTVHAITGARIVVDPGAEPVAGTLVIRDGKIEAVGPETIIPPDARRHDRTGRIIYPGFIEPYLRLDPAAGSDPASAEAGERAARGGHESPYVRADSRALDLLPLPAKRLRNLRENGFTTAWVLPSVGVFRGSGAVVGLVDDDVEAHVLLTDAGQAHAFAHGTWKDVYPNSLMGSMALTRQTFLDAEWYREAGHAWERDPREADRPAANLGLEALLPVVDHERALVMECEDLRMCERAFRLAREFDLEPVIISGGTDEYRELDWFVSGLDDVSASLVLALNFPTAPYWEYEDQTADIELDALLHWERAPTSPGRVAAAGVPFAITTQGLASPDSLFPRLRQAIRNGLSPATALAALTVEPARILGLSSRLGTLEPGKDANLLVASAPLFEEDTRVVEVWIDGVRHGDTPRRATPSEAATRWDITIQREGEPLTVPIEISREEGALSGVVRSPAESNDTAPISGGETPTKSEEDTEDEGEEVPLTDVGFVRGVLSITIPPAATPFAVDVHFQGEIRDDLIPGRAIVAGDTLRALGRRAHRGRDAAAKVDSLLSGGQPRWPSLPSAAPDAVHVRNATVWTCAETGVLQDADLLVSDGRIVAVGPGLDAPASALVIDATGYHVTPGIIDCHSHSIVTGGTNESTESTTCEVRIADVIDPWGPAIYRELAGGVTVSNMLHGSANVIGGQNAVVKYRWGEMVDGLILAEAPAGVKFALGENVKQSNWGDAYRTRYPQTRMGVEQFLQDRFSAALDHREALARWEEDEKGTPPRPDLELDAVLEMIDGSRLIHCHAYRQDEMLLLTRVMESFGVRVATFQHALEAYKIADELARAGVGASLFSDWWAYKFEVYDAIPYAGRILWERGVVTSYNSDSQDLARRLNLEAAKAVRYGDVPEEEALAFVTRNPAIQLGIAEWVGTLEPGKHADFVIWSDHPLSDRAVCEETWIEGRRFFSREEDTAAAAATEELRRELMAKAERTGANGKRASFTPTFGKHYGLSLAEDDLTEKSCLGDDARSSEEGAW